MENKIQKKTFLSDPHTSQEISIGDGREGSRGGRRASGEDPRDGCMANDFKF